MLREEAWGEEVAMALFGSPNVERLKEKGDVNGLVKALRNKDSDVQAAAARALGEVGDASVIDALRERLRNGEDDVRDQTFRALARIEGPETAFSRIGSSNIGMAAGALREDPNPDVRRLMARGLGDASGTMGLLSSKYLIEALHDDDQGVVQEVFASLIRIGDPNMIPALFEVVEDKSQPEWLRDQARHVVDVIDSPP